MIIATPSDLSCETPRPTVLSGSPVLPAPLVLYKPLRKSTPTFCVNCKTCLAITSDIPSKSPLCIQICDQILSVYPLFAVARLMPHVDSDRHSCYSARKVMELLQPLITNSNGSGLVEDNAVFFQYCYIMAFWKPDTEGPLECYLWFHKHTEGYVGPLSTLGPIN